MVKDARYPFTLPVSGEGTYMKIAFFDTKPYDIRSFDSANKDYGFQITYFENRMTRDTVSLAKGFDAVCVFVNDTIDSEIVDRLIENDVKFIALRCAGYNNVDLSAVYQRIHVVRVPAYSPYAVAEYASALMLTLNRKVHKAYNRTRESNFSINGLVGFDMHAKTAGIIGFGRIGRILAGILRGYGMRVLVHDQYPDPAASETYGITYVDLEELYRESDIISLHCPLTKETHHLINKSSIDLMKPGVMIINTGRGHLIDTKALIGGLKTGLIGSAGLDVYEEESDYFFEDLSMTNIDDDVLARLLTFNNVLITSHQAFFTTEALSNIAETTLENIRQFEKGSALENEICYRCDKQSCRKEKFGRCF